MVFPNIIQIFNQNGQESMAVDISRFRERIRAIPAKVRVEIEEQMEKELDKLVAEMQSKAHPAVKIRWTFGDVPVGGVKIKSLGSTTYGAISATIYAYGEANGKRFPNLANWFEHGISDRYNTSGAYRGFVRAQPAIFPTYRANKRRVKGNLTRALNRGIKKARG